jgi:hypothetical protein
VALIRSPRRAATTWDPASECRRHDADGITDATKIPPFVAALLAGADFAKASRIVMGVSSSRAHSSWSDDPARPNN